MNAHVTSAPALNFRARSLLAFVLEPSQPLTEWFAGLDGWLTRSPSFFASKPIILEMAGLELSLKDYRDLLGDLARRHIRVMGVENAARTLVGPHLPPVVTYEIHTFRRLQPCLMAWNWVRPLSMTIGPGLP
jgi:septum site-determining protein MinC